MIYLTTFFTTLSHFVDIKDCYLSMALVCDGPRDLVVCTPVFVITACYVIYLFVFKLFFQGDTGNALVCNGTLTGILIYDLNCGPTTFPELYTRVNNYTTWIRTYSRSSSIFAPGAFMLVLLSALIFFNA